MAEAKNNYANIEKINTLLGADGIGALLKNVQGTEKKVNEILRKISDLENEARRRVQEEAALEEAKQDLMNNENISEEDKQIIMDYFGDGSKRSPATGKPFGVDLEYYIEKTP